MPGSELAARACEIEIERCGKPIGKQDQYIAALGGVRDIRFGPGEDVVASEVRLSSEALCNFQDQLMLFYTGVTRSADAILGEQRANVACTRPQLDLLRDLAGLAVGHIVDGDIDALGAVMREGWEAKRKLATGIANAQIDDAVQRALDAGASGAKVTGAGGGGFLVVTSPVERQGAVRRSLSPGMRELRVKVDRLGSRVVLNIVRDIWS
jgi:D-glycero-alpha-D-manno-heptose-7-phosphate kinase